MNLNLKDLMNELVPISAKWFLLGLQLGVPPDILKLIEADQYDSHRRLAEVLYYWLYNHDAPSWEMLVKGLERMQEKRLAWMIHAKYVEGITA